MRLQFVGAVLVVLLAGCAQERDVTLHFTGLVGDEPVACGGVYPGIGTTSTELTLADYRVYVHDVRVVTEDGRELSVALTQDGVWQHEDTVLLDFEDGSGECEFGTAEMNTTIRGTIPEDVAIAGVRFRLGVPETLNHGDVTSAPSPLGFQSMYWNWNAGYKFLRVDARSTGLDGGLFIHLGSTGCDGDGRGNVTGCEQENRPEIALTAFDPAANDVAVDLAALLRDSDMDADLGGAPGCMSGFDDPDCEPIFHGLGLPFAGEPPSEPQRLFRVVPGNRD